MAAAKKTTVKNFKTQKRRNRSWTDDSETVLSSNENRDRPWAFTLEVLALKKTANESIFKKIRDELKVCLSAEGLGDCDLSVDQLRRKYKWLNNKIRSGSGLGTKDTGVPDWYVLLDPVFTEGVDSMLTLSCKADYIRNSDSNLQSSSSEEDLSDTTSTSSKFRQTLNYRSSATTDTKEFDDEEFESEDES